MEKTGEISSAELAYLHWLRQEGCGTLIIRGTKGLPVNLKFYGNSGDSSAALQRQFATVPQRRLQSLSNIVCQALTREYGADWDGAEFRKPISLNAFNVYNQLLDIADKAPAPAARALRVVVLGRVASMQQSVGPHDKARLQIAARLAVASNPDEQNRELARCIQRKLETRQEQDAKRRFRQHEAMARKRPDKFAIALMSLGL